MIERNGEHPTVDMSHGDGVIHLRIESMVTASTDDVWDWATTFAGVNHELMPYCRMRPPRSLRGRTLESYVPGERAACWLLAGGVIPFDRHLLGLDSMAPGAGFAEESSSWLQRRWRHERTLRALDDDTGRTLVVDQLTVRPRVRLAVPITCRMMAVIFCHRHVRLRARFGE